MQQGVEPNLLQYIDPGTRPIPLLLCSLSFPVIRFEPMKSFIRSDGSNGTSYRSRDSPSRVSNCLRTGLLVRFRTPRPRLNLLPIPGDQLGLVGWW